MRKYKQGKQIKTIADFEESKCTFFMVRSKTTHKGWITSWQYQYLKNCIEKGIIFEADLIRGKKEDKKWVDNYEDFQNASNDITYSQYPIYRGK